MNGIINVYKEKGFTSFDVVAKLRGILHQKKIGHTGTLDPDAEGVLPVCLGNATKLCDLLTDKNKTYRTVMKLGVVTDTQDVSGKVLAENTVHATSKDLEQTIYSFVGSYDQIPPMYSAKKINGKKLYELAREGKVVERKPCLVHIHQITIEKIDLEHSEVTMTVECSKGTYIRTLCHDIGAKLGCGACMKELLRTKVSCFLLENSIKLEEIEGLVQKQQIEQYVIPPDKVLEDFSAITVVEKADRLLYNGNAIYKHMIQNETEGKKEQFRVYDSKQHFVGMYAWNEKIKGYKPVKMFLP